MYHVPAHKDCIYPAGQVTNVARSPRFVAYPAQAPDMPTALHSEAVAELIAMYRDGRLGCAVKRLADGFILHRHGRPTWIVRVVA